MVFYCYTSEASERFSKSTKMASLDFEKRSRAMAFKNTEDRFTVVRSLGSLYLGQ